MNPYLALATLRQLQDEKYVRRKYSLEKLEKNYIKAVNKGLLKVMSKMGISTQQSYRGAQIFEAIGLNRKFVDEFFTWTASRIEGVGLETIAEESLRRHEHAYPRADVPRRSTSTSAGNTNGAARAKRTCSIPKSSPSCSRPRGSTAATNSASTAS